MYRPSTNKSEGRIYNPFRKVNYKSTNRSSKFEGKVDPFPGRSPVWEQVSTPRTLSPKTSLAKEEEDLFAI